MENKFRRATVTLEFNKVLGMLTQLAATDGAAELLSRLEPVCDRERVAYLQMETTDAKRMLMSKGAPSFGRIKNILEHVDRAEKGAMLTPRELLDIANVFRTARMLAEYIKTDKQYETVLDVIFSRITTNKFLEDRITGAIISEELIADDASAELGAIRRKMSGANNRIRQTLQKYITSSALSKFLQENIITIRNGRYVIPVKSEYKSEIKGLVHDTSSSGATLFIEPMAVVETNNEIKVLAREEEAEIERILYSLSADTAAYGEALRLDYYNITYLAAVFARAQLSVVMDACSPRLVSQRRVSLRRARHPLLGADSVVPIDIRVGGDFDTLVITGPNTGGKTVSLKTLGLLSLMVQSGLHIPASELSEVCVFDDILADIGDEQSIEQSLSTFSAHMTNIVNMIGVITENTLVLFDELGAGTDPVEGAALAMAILEHVRSTKALCAATTHYAELKAYAIEEQGVCNASCEFDVETLRPTYRLIIGAPGRSNAFAIASKLGMPDNIIDHARASVRSDSKRFEQVIAQLEAERGEMEEAKREAQRLRAELEETKQRDEAKIRARLSASEKELQRAREQAKRMLDSAKASSDFIFARLNEVQKHQNKQTLGAELARAREEVRAQLREGDEKFNPVTREDDGDYELPRPLKLGDSVKIRSLGVSGTVKTLPDKNGSMTVTIGTATTKVNVKDVRLEDMSGARVTSGKKTYRVSEYTSAVRSTAKPEIDLRGENGDDAWLLIDKFFDESSLAGFGTVTLIHGKGTGALRASIWKSLRGDKRVKSFRLGAWGEGDAGVTVVELK